MTKGKPWKRPLLVVLLVLGVFILVAAVYLAARFVGYLLGIIILYTLVKGLSRIFRWRPK